MKVVVLGAGTAGRFLIEEIKRVSKYIEIVGVLDNKITGEYMGIPICRPDVFLKEHKDVEAAFIAAGAQKTVGYFVELLRYYGIDNIYMLHDIAGKNMISPFDAEGKIKGEYLRRIYFSEEKPTLPYFEVPITDCCNLNCKGCLFACNPQNQGEHISYKQLEKDAEKMRALFYDVPWIRILGGEPLMHPDICEILSMYRKLFLESEIDLCTNGLLIPRMSNTFFECLVKNRITVHVSGYKPTYSILEKIDKTLAQYQLNYTVLKREEFVKYYTTDQINDADYNFCNCIASGCRELYKGKLLRCSAVIAFEKMNEQYDVKYEINDTQDCFDIHEDSVDAWKIKHLLDNASPICKYCDVKHMQKFAWENAGMCPPIHDYIID